MMDIVEKIILVFKPYHHGEMAYDEKWFREKIERRVKSNQRLDLLILAFPGKSINLNSVSGHLPDLGEEIALMHLRNFLKEINMLYKPGATLHIVSDGYYFDRTGCIRPVHELDAYISEMNKMKNSDQIRIYTIHDFYPHGDIDQKIADFEKQYVPDISEVYYEVKNNPYYRDIYPDRMAFIYHEFTPILFPNYTKSQRQKMTKVIARHFIGCQIGVDRMIREHFPNHIRLSIHRQNNPAAQKYYINLLPGISGDRSPWFRSIKDLHFLQNAIAA